MMPAADESMMSHVTLTALISFCFLSLIVLSICVDAVLVTGQEIEADAPAQPSSSQYTFCTGMNELQLRCNVILHHCGHFQS